MTEQSVVVSVGRITKVFKPESREHTSGYHAEARFVDDDGPRDIPLELDKWDVNLSVAGQCFLLKPHKHIP